MGYLGCLCHQVEFIDPEFTDIITSLLTAYDVMDLRLPKG